MLEPESQSWLNILPTLDLRLAAQDFVFACLIMTEREFMSW
jgi:hypothetical protein